MQLEALERIDYGDEAVLVVDDEEAVCHTLADLLAHLGFKVEQATTAAEALKKLHAGYFTLLLSDISMPGVDGIELIRKVRTAFPDICSIAMTGHTQKYTYVDVVNAGASDFINKPVGVEELEAKLRRTIIERNIREELSRMSFTDALTGLYNHRYFYIRLHEEVKRAQRQAQHLALIMLDLDGFKDYNDRHGHLAGDQVLRQVGRIIRSDIRQGVDSGYRYGGDEFAVILIDADAEVAQAIASRIERSIARVCRLTASSGWVRLEDGMNAEDLVAEADRRLYHDKGNQRVQNEARRNVR